MSNSQHLQLVDSETVTVGRRPPHDPLVESEVVSACLTSADARSVARHLLSADDFHLDDLRLIWGALVACDDEGELAGASGEDAVVLVAQRLRADELIYRAGGARRLGEVLGAAPARAQHDRLCRKLVDLRRLRQALAIVHQLANDGYTAVATHDPQRWLQEAASALQSVADDAPAVGVGTADTAALEAVEWARRAHAGDRAVLGLRLPWREVQNKTEGLFFGETLVLTARTGGGKTLCSGEIAQYVAEHSRHAAGVWSLEMPKRQLMSRMGVARARISAHALRGGRLSDDSLVAYEAALEELRKMPLFFDEHRPRMGWRSVTSILATMSRYRQMCPRKFGRPLGVMVLDFVQKIDFSDVAPKKSREYQMNMGSDLLVREAERQNIALVMLCQTNEDGQIRESKAVAHHAHSHWHLEITRQRGGEWRATIQIRKARHGSTGRVDVGYDPVSVRFFDE